jgi:hypothetical protein
VDAAQLQQQFKVVTDVKQASLSLDSNLIYQPHRADLVVHTWMGAVLYVYWLHSEPRLRDLRSLLKDNSRTGIGTLFLCDVALLPAPARAIHLNDWQEALRGLSESCIYGCTAGQRLVPVHFHPTPIAGQFDCTHSADFVLEHVSVRRRTLSGSLKGDYYLGDIASPAYRRRIHYERVHQRFHHDTRSAPRQVQTAPVDTLMQYYRLLGVERHASEKEVKTAFRRLALNIHPDVSALPRQEAERRIKELLTAYDFIKTYHGWS